MIPDMYDKKNIISKLDLMFESYFLARIQIIYILT